MNETLRKNCPKAAHIVMPWGEVFVGGRAMLVVLENIGWGAWARFIRRSPFVYIFDLGYLIVSRNRPFFAKFLFKNEPVDDEPGS